MRLDDEFNDVNLVPVPIGAVVLEVAQLVTMRPTGRRMVVFERFLEPMTVMPLVRSRLRRRRHHDVRVTVPVGVVGAVGMLDDFEQAVHVRLRIMRMTVLVLVIVPMRHGSMLGQRPALARQDQP